MLSCIRKNMFSRGLKNCQQQFSATFHHNTSLHDGGNGIKISIWDCSSPPRMSCWWCNFILDFIAFSWESSPEINFASFAPFARRCIWKGKKVWKGTRYTWSEKAILSCFENKEEGKNPFLSLKMEMIFMALHWDVNKGERKFILKSTFRYYCRT